MQKIILASTSPSRKDLLEKTGLRFEVVASEYEEDMTLPKPPKALAKYLSRGKAQAVAERYPDAIVIAADTFVVHGNAVLGKPKSKADAKRMLRSFSGKSHTLLTGLTIMRAADKKTVSKTVELKVYFKKLAPKEIDAYIATGEPMDKAGAYAIQGIGAILIKKTEGDYLGAVGLPLYVLGEELKRFGVAIL